MKAILIFLIFFILSTTISAQLDRCPEIKCEPNQEFPDPNKETAEWDNFMELLDEKTFQNYTTTCHDGREVKIHKDSPIIWDLRFKLYSESEENVKMAITDCYCQVQDCGAPFQACMKLTRQNFIHYLNTEWNVNIQKGLEVLCSLKQQP